ncbi:hypothetical protein [Actinoplanes sp. NPDC049599]|uniref:hypothetical protein n=1 Tax=Actinoplanes sp. NPDC049599 TaxID=3363903 RepID=UPI0037AE3E5A
MTTDSTLARIGHAVALHHSQGRPAAARQLFAQLWDEIGGERGDPLHVCVLAHSMADVQDDVHQELLWDRRALAAAALLTEDRVAAAGVPLSVAGLYPSLHLNLADCYRKLDDLDRAREHLRLAEAGIGALGDDAYGQLIKDGLDRLAQLLRPSQPLTVQIYCRLTVTVHRPEAVTDLAVRQLRDADIDWSAEEDDLETAAGELRADLLNSLAGLVEPDRLLDGIPGVTAEDARVWAEPGDPHPRFQPGFRDPD